MNINTLNKSNNALSQEDKLRKHVCLVAQQQYLYREMLYFLFHLLIAESFFTENFLHSGNLTVFSSLWLDNVLS